jgi:hypothetical protein
MADPNGVRFNRLNLRPTAKGEWKLVEGRSEVLLMFAFGGAGKGGGVELVLKMFKFEIQSLQWVSNCFDGIWKQGHTSNPIASSQQGQQLLILAAGIIFNPRRHKWVAWTMVMLRWTRLRNSKYELGFLPNQSVHRVYKGREMMTMVEALSLFSVVL